MQCNLSCLFAPGWGAIHWIAFNPPMAIPVKKTDSPCPQKPSTLHNSHAIAGDSWRITQDQVSQQWMVEANLNLVFLKLKLDISDLTNVG